MRLPALSRPLRSLVATALVAPLVAAGSLLAATAPAHAADTPVPGDVTGYGFDQCLAPTQTQMTRWLEYSPFLSAGIYLSGDSRACTSQPNLTRRWIHNQVTRGWRLLPITLGPQASCTTRDRYLRQVRINASTTRMYAAARAQGVREADKTVARAQSLGIPAGSTMYYDIEAWDTSRSAACNASAMYFLQSWTIRLKNLGWRSGVYSSAASGMKLLDDQRVAGRLRMPDEIWVADWNGRADVASTYIRADGWMPHARVHQYQGGHDETWGGVRINIDRNWLDVGAGSQPLPTRTHCGGVDVDLGVYPALRSYTTQGAAVRALKCLLQERGRFRYGIDGTWNKAVSDAARSWSADHGLPFRGTWTTTHWIAFLTEGAQPVLKLGSVDPAVRRVQRALNAAGVRGIEVTGRVDRLTSSAISTYQGGLAIARSSVVNPATWLRLARGQR